MTERRHFRIVPSKLATRKTNVDATELEHQKEMFREARKAREIERMKRLREMRLHNTSTNVATNVSFYTSQSNRAANNLPLTASNRGNIKPKTACMSRESKPSAREVSHSASTILTTASTASSSLSQPQKLPVTSSKPAQKAPVPSKTSSNPSAGAVNHLASTILPTASTASSSFSQPKKLPVTSEKPVQEAPVPSKTTGMARDPKLGAGRLPRNRPATQTKPTVLPGSSTPLKPTTERRVRQNKRRSFGVPSSKVNSSRKKKQFKLSLKSKMPTEDLSQPKLFIRQTKTSQLRLLRADPRLQYAMNVQKNSTSSKEVVKSNAGNTLGKSVTDGKKVGFAVDVEKSPTLPSTPLKKTLFSSSTPHTPIGTPKPVVLRENLSDWLEKKGLSLNDFKHLRCFGVNLPSGVKRPQTPFRRVIQSTSKLRVIPESAESTPHKNTEMVSTPEAEDSVLNTTYTMEDEDKENLEWSPSSDFLANSQNAAEEKIENIQNSSVSDYDCVKNHDKACGVLSELHQLIKEGYPSDQCELWVRAIRRRFPQCGDEAVYWECLASLEESRGDFHSAVECYERAVLQGAEDTVHKLLHELRLKLVDLNIDDVPTVSEKQGEINQTPRKRRSTAHLDPSNIIQSAAIQFAVKEKCLSTQKGQMNVTDELDTLLTATPVRRSTRPTASPFHKSETRGLKCIRSLDVLEPDVRRSLIFQSNTALEPRE